MHAYGRARTLHGDPAFVACRGLPHAGGSEACANVSTARFGQPLGDRTLADGHGRQLIAAHHPTRPQDSRAWAACRRANECERERPDRTSEGERSEPRASRACALDARADPCHFSRLGLPGIAVPPVQAPILALCETRGRCEGMPSPTRATPARAPGEGFRVRGSLRAARYTEPPRSASSQTKQTHSTTRHCNSYFCFASVYKPALRSDTRGGRVNINRAA